VFCGAIAVLLVVVLARALVPSVIRTGRFSRAARALPPEVRREVLEVIDRRGVEARTPLVLLLPDGEPASPPKPDGELASVMLQSPPLPPEWGRRRIHLVCDANGDVHAALEARDGDEEASLGRGRPLEHVRLARVPGAGPSPFHLVALLRSAHPERLGTHTDMY